MIKIDPQALGKVAFALQDPTVKIATVYLSDKETIRGTRIGKHDRRQRRAYFHLAIGHPNYSERKFIRQAKLAGESFPVKRVQIKLAKKS